MISIRSPFVDFISNSFQIFSAVLELWDIVGHSKITRAIYLRRGVPYMSLPNMFNLKKKMPVKYFSRRLASRLGQPCIYLRMQFFEA